MTLNEALSLIDSAGPLLSRTGNAQHHSGQAQHWADLGCGDGLFTEAIARLLPTGSTVRGIDTRPGLKSHTTSNGVTLTPMKADFVRDDLGLHDLDGILMANSLHYVKDQSAFLQRLRTHMHPHAPFLIVEYDTDTPVPRWVPYPLSYASVRDLFNDAGFSYVEKLGERPSAYGRANIYAAIAVI